MDKETRKRLKQKYRTRRLLGGVFAVKNKVNGKMLLLSTSDMQGSLNLFAFAQQTGGCVYSKLRGVWNETDFAIEVIEELEKKEEQSDKEFAQEIQALYEIVSERYSADQLY